jgi:hypothetical protein
MPSRTLETLAFDNTFARLPEAFFARVSPTALTGPHLVSFNPDAAALLDLDPDEANRQEFAGVFGGHYLLPGSDPVAMLYAGHQFGHYVSRLGDGRAILLGQVRNPSGETWDVHLKGAGLTPFSRDDDGRAVLRSCIREYLCSEAMHGLGIPTTRALCVIGSEEPVHREQVETGATMVRLASSHIRFGSFEGFYYRRQPEYVKTLADYVMADHFPEFVEGPERYGHWLGEVAARTGRLIAAWQAVGFAHGVMNSDNMSVVGLTLDYGPFGFLDEYNPAFICNHSDTYGRYAFQNQPDIGYFNLRCFIQAISPLITEADGHAALARYGESFESHYAALMRAKLGFRESRPEDADLLVELLRLMGADRVDYTIFFRALGTFQQDAADGNAVLRDFFLHREGFDDWALRYRARLQAEGSRDEERRVRMNRVNPKYILRNYLAHEAIRRAKEEKDFSEIERLWRLLRDPFTEQPGMEAYASPPPDWARSITVSCSS